jgi:hypothetical protein
MKRQTLARAIAEEQEMPMTLEAYRRRRALEIGDEEVAATIDLVRWFCRRYPTAKDRFAYVNRKYEEWTRRGPADPG